MDHKRPSAPLEIDPSYQSAQHIYAETIAVNPPINTFAVPIAYPPVSQEPSLLPYQRSSTPSTQYVTTSITTTAHGYSQLPLSINDSNTVTGTNSNYCGPVSQGGLLPEGLLNQWRVGLCTRCCSCSGYCFLSWCCPFLVSGMIAQKLSIIGFQVGGLTYKSIVLTYLGILLFDSFIAMITKSHHQGLMDLYFHNIYLVYVIYMLRNGIRERFNIPGHQLYDLCGSCFCAPCYLTQMMTQLWPNPEAVPGCNCWDVHSV